MWTNNKFVSGRHHSASYDHLQHRHVGWTVMAHHESHCGGRRVHFPKINALSIWCDQGISVDELIVSTLLCNR